MTDILFICKRNETYGFQNFNRRTSGLFNSTRFIVESLCKRGIVAEIVEAIDNNCIDRIVTIYKPKKVIIEALWVVPDKFDVLMKLHPSIKWYVHMHSGMPFLALEGIAMSWLHHYEKRGVGIIANSKESYDALSVFVDDIICLPNVYLSNTAESDPYDFKIRSTINVGCFGAIRPMKNHLTQALAAIRLAKEFDLNLKFYINATRVETGGHPVIKNLRELFHATPNASLIELGWMEPEDFIDYLNSYIDIGMQVSLTETFNVVCADYVTAGIPVVCSKEVKWMPCFNKAEDDSIDDIVNKMKRALKCRYLIKLSQWNLKRYSNKSQKMWLEFVNG